MKRGMILGQHFRSDTLKSHSPRQLMNTIDDTSPAINYVGLWFEEGFAPGYNNTMHRTDTAGAAIEYTFSAISVYGPVGITASFGTPVSTYSVDGSTPTTFTAPEVTGTEPEDTVLFFSASNLSAGEHTLTIKRTSTDNAVYFFDFMQVLPAEPGTSVPSSPATSVSSPAPTNAADPTIPVQQPSPTPSLLPSVSSATSDDAIPSQVTSFPEPSESELPSSLAVSPTSAQTSLPDQGSSPTVYVSGSNIPSASDGSTGLIPSATPAFATTSPKTNPTKYVVAGVVAAVAVAILAIIGITYLVRRRRQRVVITAFSGERRSIDNESMRPLNSGTSMMKEHAPTGLRIAHIAEPAPESVSMYSSESFLDLTSPVAATRTHHFPASNNTLVDLSHPTPTPPVVSQTRTPKTVRETDGGVRLAGGPFGSASELLPPAYSPSFGRV
ncbi:hypothetical protein BC835DRAFT_662634 [Cytidiella melzeri]|nr:hypothetical protein BC835DRAFT_662634 [Cytidiella melzeri]